MRTSPQRAARRTGSPSEGVPSGPVRLHIDELILHGFAPGDRHAIASAVQVELARLIRDNRCSLLLRSSLALANMYAGEIQVNAGSRPETAGSQIARSLFRTLRQHISRPVGASAAAPRLGGANR